MTEMAGGINPLAGQRAPASMRIDVDALVAAYHADQPDPTVAAQRVAFGTSGHRGSAFDRSFNEWHVLAITQAICNHRKSQAITGPLFMGIDTHALSEPACASALEVLAANGVEVMLAAGDEFTPTPAVSHAILTHNRGRNGRLADGIVITPSHNPPRDGGFKYNPPHGGPAGADITAKIEAAANVFIEARLHGVQRMPHAQALQAATTHRFDYLSAYVGDLASVIDMDVIRNATLRMGVDPLGGAGVHYWAAIAERYRLDLTVVSDVVDPTFGFMTLDWDGKIRMDPSSKYAMQRLQSLKDRFDIAFACDTDHDRHGIVTPSLAARLGRTLQEVPVGFKWFVDGLHDGSLGFCGEESAGASFLRRDGSVWTTDKDGITAALLSAEITACTGHDIGTLYQDLATEFGDPVADRVQAPATSEQKQRLAALAPRQIVSGQLAGENIESVLDRAPGNSAPIGGIKVIAASGWFAARPSGTEDIYKIYAESFKGVPHLRRVLQDAQSIVDAAIAPASDS